MTEIKTIEAVLKLYNKSYLVIYRDEEKCINVYDNLCRKFFITLNERIEGLDFWYKIEPGYTNSLVIRVIKGEQL